ncbi:MAG TPA: hypothetical protein VGQ36_11540 [Thermoanaerobaculia bacterium]|nr:hypothetical protein [Thermoanaerobaculia bacterium]
MGKEISPEKLLDMIRSILPSTARVRARRAKAAKSRKVRRRVHAALHHEDAEETKLDLYQEANQRVNVWDRRGADKLNHFMRWCESWTRGMTERQALDAVRAVLPRNLIGDHAFSHWESHVKYRHRRYAYVSGERQWQSRYDKTRHRLRQALSIDPGFPGRFNAAVKEKKEPELPRRMLHGLHDVDAFVADVLNKHDYHLEERVLLGLLTEVEQYGLGEGSVILKPRRRRRIPCLERVTRFGRRSFAVYAASG